MIYNDKIVRKEEWCSCLVTIMWYTTFNFKAISACETLKLMDFENHTMKKPRFKRSFVLEVENGQVGLLTGHNRSGDLHDNICSKTLIFINS